MAAARGKLGIRCGKAGVALDVCIGSDLTIHHLVPDWVVVRDLEVLVLSSFLFFPVRIFWGMFRDHTYNVIQLVGHIWEVVGLARGGN